jgi:hypothetical protein
MRTDRAGRANQHSKGFLVLFFKKELLPSSYDDAAPMQIAMPLGIVR